MRRCDYGVYSLDGCRSDDSKKLLEDRFGRNYKELFDKVDGCYGGVVHTVTINKKFYHIKRERKKNKKDN